MRIGAQDPTALLAAQAQASSDPARGAAELAAQARRAARETGADSEKTRAAADKLEALFGTLLVKQMRSSQSAGLFGEGTSGDVYGGWFDQFLGEVLARRGSLHLSESIQRSLAPREANQP